MYKIKQSTVALYTPYALLTLAPPLSMYSYMKNGKVYNYSNSLRLAVIYVRDIKRYIYIIYIILPY